MQGCDMFLDSSVIPQSDWQMVSRLLLAALLGGAIGWNRELRRRPAGLRTHMLVSLGAALFTLVPLAASQANDLHATSSTNASARQTISASTGSVAKSRFRCGRRWIATSAPFSAQSSNRMAPLRAALSSRQSPILLAVTKSFRRRWPTVSSLTSV